LESLIVFPVLQIAVGRGHVMRSGFRSDLRSAAINEQFDTGDEAGVIRRQKQRHPGNLIRVPMRPIGMVDTIRAIASAGCPTTAGVSVGPGLTTFERMRRSFNSAVQVRMKERMAAFVAP
jgi:hypothetical protein